MKDLTRRECLKKSAIIAAGVAVAGCSSGSEDVQLLGNPEMMKSGEAYSAYEGGRVPVAESGWTKPEGVHAGYSSLKRDLRADVAIVGAGLAGSSLALHLAKFGVNVALLEARQPGWGASGRNAGHVLPTMRDLKVFKSFPDQGKQFLEVFKEHHNIAYDLAEEYAIDCDAAQTGYLDACLSKSAFETYKKLSRFWSEQHGQQVSFLGETEMRKMAGSSYYPYGVYYHAGGRINPYRFTNGMAAAAESLGASIFGESEVTALTQELGGWRVSTAQGSVLADRVVFCTNAYSSDVVPEFANSFYPLTAYTISTKPIPEALKSVILPKRPAFAQMPVDLNPMVIDEHDRIIISSIPGASSAGEYQGYFKNHLRWIERTWPEVRDYTLEMESYWTGRVALRDEQFPGVYELNKGVYGLMHFNAWGNTMAPLMGRLMAEAIAADDWQKMPAPLQRPVPVSSPNKQHLMIRKIMIPAARVGQRFGFI